MLIAELTVPGEPVPKGRPRLGRGHTFTPARTVAFETAVRTVWDAEPRPDPPECVRLDVSFYMGTHRRTDIDNLVKAVADALNLRSYDDDWRIHDLRARKFYTTRDRARTEIHVYAINPDREETV